MTLVSIICLNHQAHFNSFWSSDLLGELRFDVCKSAFHRRFHFIGGLVYPYSIAWIVEKNNFDSLENQLFGMNRQGKVGNILPRENLEQFLTDWKTVVNESYHPEFFFLAPFKEMGLTYETLPSANKNHFYSLKVINQALTLTEDALLSEPKEEDNALIEKFQTLANSAATRMNACRDCQKVPRSLEKEFLALIGNWQKNNLLEQRWLAVVALHFYQKGKLSEFDNYYSLIKKFLLDDFYLIRKEAYELLSTLFLVQPPFGIKVTDNLLQEHNLNLKLFGIDILKRFVSLVIGLRNDRLFFKHPYQISLTPAFAKELLPLLDKSFDIQETIYNHIKDKETFKELSFPKKSVIYQSYEQENLFTSIQTLAHSLNILRTLHQPYRKYQFK